MTGCKKEAVVLIRNIFRYMDKDAKDIMTHRKNIVAIDGEEILEDALRFMLEESYSRFLSIMRTLTRLQDFCISERRLPAIWTKVFGKRPVAELRLHTSGGLCSGDQEH